MSFLSSGVFESVSMEKSIFEGENPGPAEVLINNELLTANVEKVAERFLAGFKLLWTDEDINNKYSLLHGLYTNLHQKRSLISGEKSAFIGIGEDSVSFKKTKKTSLVTAEEVPFVVMKGGNKISVVLSRLVMVSLRNNK